MGRSVLDFKKEDWIVNKTRIRKRLSHEVTKTDHLRVCNKLSVLGKDANKSLQSCNETAGLDK